MASTSDAIATEEELDKHLLELQQKKQARAIQARRHQIQFDIGLLVFVLILIIGYASIPVLPAHIGERVGSYVDSSWEFIPIIFIMLALSRLVTYALTRSYPDA